MKGGNGELYMYERWGRGAINICMKGGDGELYIYERWGRGAINV